MSQHKLLQLIDQAKPNLQPLNTHYMAQFSIAERQDYATMLAAVITGTGTVTEAQSRLFGMLLTSMNLDINISQYFALSQNINHKFIESFIRKIHRTKVSESFLFDTIVLFSLDKNIKSKVRLLSEIKCLFDVHLNVEDFFKIMVDGVIPFKSEYIFLFYKTNEIYHEVKKTKKGMFDLIDNEFINIVDFKSKYIVDFKVSNKCVSLHEKQHSTNCIYLGKLNGKYKFTIKNKNIDNNKKSSWYDPWSSNDYIIDDYNCYISIITLFKLPEYLSAWTEFFKDLEVKK
ncbi:hypothetical protein GLP11_04125 [Photobacterium carnosum]|uniref:hypothetical protein n=2 Tax=Photobacterium carnosum TaxID=2023717 RepID=UPI001F25B64B|nr:hypothetical protein [Photobacterium carnosum]MCF2153178.1 hypothetical protein [Photobacterium carnosum]MCF2214938.1 hypothetical protein [Photobacterium carnosum]